MLLGIGTGLASTELPVKAARLSWKYLVELFPHTKR